jgi:histidine ammonia-lyase
MPASVFSRSTESHNQDKVSMGSLAVFDLERVLELTESVQAIQLIACAQALECRARLPGAALAVRPRAVWELVRRSIPATLEDRAMDADIDSARALVAGGALWTLLGEPAC